MAVVFVMFMLLVGISAPADADVLCANPSGSVFVRTQCKGNETQLNPVALGLVGPPGPQGPAGVTAGFFRERLTGEPLNGTRDVLFMDVGAARSILYATVQLLNTHVAAFRTGICDLVAPDGTARRGFVGIAPGEQAQLTLINISTVPGAAKITCYDSGDHKISLDVPTTLSAIELTTIHEQPPPLGGSPN